MARIDPIAELEVARDVERQLLKLYVSSPSLSQLPIAPLRGLADLVRLELALRRFAKIHRSKRSNELIRAVRAVLEAARARLEAAAATTESSETRLHQAPFRDTPPAT